MATACGASIPPTPRPFTAHELRTIVRRYHLAPSAANTRAFIDACNNNGVDEVGRVFSAFLYQLQESSAD